MKGITDKEAESIFVLGRGTYCNLTMVNKENHMATGTSLSAARRRALLPVCL